MTPTPLPDRTRPCAVVTWTYVITNIGNVTLTLNVTLTDDKSRRPAPVDSLAPNATTTCTTTGIAGGAQYTNTAIVTGTNSLTPTQKVTKTRIPATTMAHNRTSC
ncbi:MAG: hypothetical protein U0350_16235 [Caldilineaceae bacterium]